MANICDINGKCVKTGNRRSTANNATRRKFYPNIQKKFLYLSELKIWLQLSVSTKAMRTINKNGLYHTMKKACKKGTLNKNLSRLIQHL